MEEYSNRYATNECFYAVFVRGEDLKDSVVIDATKSNHWTRFVNDPHGTSLKANMEFVNGGFLKCIMEIEPNTELIVSYGAGYWD